MWLDEFQIEIGDSVRRRIDESLANSRFGAVILSEVFLTKNWTGHELDALWELDAVLPVWHGIDKNGIDKQTLMKYSPLLAGRRWESGLFVALRVLRTARNDAHVS